MSGTATSLHNADAQRDSSMTATDMGNRNTLAPDDAGAANQGQGLLQVPSRSSSQQKGQSAIAAAGQSGASAGRSSTSGRSKDSSNSLVEGQGNGAISAAAYREGDPSTNPSRSQPNSPSASEQKRRKKGGLLALLGCCGVSDSSNTVEADKENVHKLDKLPQQPITAKSRNPVAQDLHAVRQSNEKSQPATTAEEHGASSASQDVIMEDSEPHKTAAPALNVEPPSSPQPASGGLSSEQDDTVMPDAPQESGSAHAHADVESPEEPEDRTIPPPPPPAPPGSGPPVATPFPVTETVEELRKWLLPPIAAEHKGRKCLVLDLDETLVHSSFKVCTSMQNLGSSTPY
jgi:RNA polymerase II subunit A small phosphatase-like protein